jgi:hypothetical protein
MDFDAGDAEELAFGPDRDRISRGKEVRKAIER